MGFGKVGTNNYLPVKLEHSTDQYCVRYDGNFYKVVVVSKQEGLTNRIISVEVTNMSKVVDTITAYHVLRLFDEHTNIL